MDSVGKATDAHSTCGTNEGIPATALLLAHELTNRSFISSRRIGNVISTVLALALTEILPRLWTTIWQRKALWKTLFQNKSSGTINPVYLPQTTKKVSINETLSLTTHAQYFILLLQRNIPLITMTSIELRLLNTCCIIQKGDMLRREQQASVAAVAWTFSTTHSLAPLLGLQKSH